jgi:hypothetical protein
VAAASGFSISWMIVGFQSGNNETVSANQAGKLTDSSGLRKLRLLSHPQSRLQWVQTVIYCNHA